MNYSMKWQLKDEIPIRVGKNKWQQVAQFQPSLWRKGHQEIDLSFLKPEPYTFVVADARYDIDLVKEAMAKIILYLTDSGVSFSDLTVKIEGKEEVKADEYRKILGSWVYGSIKVEKEEPSKKRLLITQMGANPSIDHDLAVYVVPNGNGEIQLLTNDRNLANNEYDAQCGSDIPLSDLVITYDSAMNAVAPFGRKARTERMVKKLDQLLKPDGHAILLCEDGLYDTFRDVIVAPKNAYERALREIETTREKPFEQVVLIYDLAYTKIRNVLV